MPKAAVAVVASLAPANEKAPKVEATVVAVSPAPDQGGFLTQMAPKAGRNGTHGRHGPGGDDIGGSDSPGVR